MKKKIRPKWIAIGKSGTSQIYKVGSFIVSDAGSKYLIQQSRFVVKLRSGIQFFGTRQEVEAAIATAIALSK